MKFERHDFFFLLLNLLPLFFTVSVIPAIFPYKLASPLSFCNKISSQFLSVVVNQLKLCLFYSCSITTTTMSKFIISESNNTKFQHPFTCQMDIARILLEEISFQLTSCLQDPSPEVSWINPFSSHLGIIKEILRKSTHCKTRTPHILPSFTRGHGFFSDSGRNLMDKRPKLSQSQMSEYQKITQYLKA